MTQPLEHLRDWIGREESTDDVVRRDFVRGLYATLDRADRMVEPLVVPRLIHWLHFHPLATQSELGPDGHPKRGGFLPPVPLPRRMWAGSRMRFNRTPSVGERITRRSTIKDVKITEGKTGTISKGYLMHNSLRGFEHLLEKNRSYAWETSRKYFAQKTRSYGIPFAIEPVVYDFTINERGSWGTLRTGPCPAKMQRSCPPFCGLTTAGLRCQQ